MCRFTARMGSFPIAAITFLAGLAMAAWAMTGNAHAAPTPGTGIEILTRGPVHEAFARSPEPITQGGNVVKPLPPDPIPELPPDQKPNRKNVQWIPGYWHWDEEQSTFLWVSGIWRVPPPGHVWIPGSWHTVHGGHQWVAGFWQSTATPTASQSAPTSSAEMRYLPPPPSNEPQEAAAKIATPSDSPSSDATFCVPGHWVWRERYVWQPGFWTDHRPGWVWVPAQYSWTPAGYLFVNGYWDYPLAERGMLFAPVRLAPAVAARTDFVFTPSHTVSQNGLIAALFIRRGCGNYFFGDYFDTHYTAAGYRDFGGTNSDSGFATVNRSLRIARVDPLWFAVRFQHRADATWSQDLMELYQARLRGELPRPPRSFAQQTRSSGESEKIHTHGTRTPRTNRLLAEARVMVQALAQDEPSTDRQTVPQAERLREQQLAREMRTLALQRQRMETQLVDRGQAVTSPGSAPRLAQCLISPAVMARVPDSRSVPPLPTQSTRNELHSTASTPAPETLPAITLAASPNAQVAVITAHGFAKPAPVDTPATPKAAPQLPQPRTIPIPPPLSLQVPNRK